MKSQDIVNYLTQIGSNQRKLEYCRQILAENSKFNPHILFNTSSSNEKTTLHRSQFFQLLSTIGVSNLQQELEMVYSYFQIDAKSFITIDQLSELVLPKSSSVINTFSRAKQSNTYSLDYSLKFALQKFFTQVLENQKKLQTLTKNFSNKRDLKIKHKKIDIQNLKSFLAAFGKYPNQITIQSIYKEINLNKGQGIRNRQIINHINEFNNQKQSKHLTPRANLFNIGIKNSQKDDIIISDNHFKSVKNTEENRLVLKDISQGLTNQLNFNTNTDSFIQKKFSNSINNSNLVQNRIKELMDSIKIKNQNSLNKHINQKIITKPTTQFTENICNKDIIQIQKSNHPEKYKTNCDFNQVCLPQKQKTRENIRKVISNKRQNQVQKKIGVYKKSKMISQQNANKQNDLIIRPKTRIVTFSDYSSNIESNKLNQNAKRIEYLKNLIGDKQEV